jgi:hypothetical protein
MEGKWETNFKPLAVKMSDGSLLAGKVNIRNFQRLSDFFRQSDDQFITMLAAGGQEGEPTQKVIMVNKSYIVWAETQD